MSSVVFAVAPCVRGSGEFVEFLSLLVDELLDHRDSRKVGRREVLRCLVYHDLGS